ncbi:MAG: DNA methyltransferase [Actinomycetota bacterium]|nr:DNA methyltransferase [Actinomycetota bacterium]MDA8358961.1 DNA methyltransferase [Actinomycetota bacterium]
MTRRASFQVMAPLDDAALAALRSDIAAHGVQVPIVRTKDGRIIDGHNRAAIANELGLDCPSTTVDLDDQQATETALRLNILRRHMGPIAWADAFRRLADVRGVKLGQGARNDRTSDSVSEVARPIDLSALATELGVNPRTARRRLRLAAKLADHPDLAAKVDRGEIDARRAEELVRRENFDRRRAEAPPPPAVTLGDGIEVRTGDFREVLADLPDGSVDAIVCDPPYDDAGVPLYSDLSAFAARVLKPGRLVVAYAGKVDLPEQLGRLGEHLEYVWLGAVFHPGRHSEHRARMVRGRWRPVAVFSAGRYSPRHWFIDAVMSEGNGAKGPTDHRWQQSLGPFVRWVEQAAEVGELVVDPFCGSGTTALACRAAGRRFLGCDVDPASVSLTLERLVDDGAGDGGCDG